MSVFYICAFVWFSIMIIIHLITWHPFWVIFNVALLVHVTRSYMQLSDENAGRVKSIIKKIKPILKNLTTIEKG